MAASAEIDGFEVSYGVESVPQTDVPRVGDPNRDLGPQPFAVYTFIATAARNTAGLKGDDEPCCRS